MITFLTVSPLPFTVSTMSVKAFYDEDIWPMQASDDVFWASFIALETAWPKGFLILGDTMSVCGEGKYQSTCQCLVGYVISFSACYQIKGSLNIFQYYVFCPLTRRL